MWEWINRFKQKKGTLQDSRPLKAGEIKGILISMSNQFFPDFEFVAYKTGFYTFQRIRVVGEYRVFQKFHIGFSLKGGAFSCSLAWSFNPSYIHNHHYNSGPFNLYVDLIQLKRGPGGVPVEEAYYYHNGMLERTTQVGAEIFVDLKTYGIPYMDKKFAELARSEITHAGLDFLRRLEVDRDELKQAIESELASGGHLISSIKHPKYINLKKTLQAVPGQSREMRKRLPKAALELLEVYWSI